MKYIFIALASVFMISCSMVPGSKYNELLNQKNSVERELAKYKPSQKAVDSLNKHIVLQAEGFKNYLEQVTGLPVKVQVGNTSFGDSDSIAVVVVWARIPSALGKHYFIFMYDNDLGDWKYAGILGAGIVRTGDE